MKDHAQEDGRGRDLAELFAPLAKHEDCMNKSHAIQNGRNTKPD